MQVAECVDVEDIGEAGGQTQVLKETREHVPRITLYRLVSMATQVQLDEAYIKERRKEVYTESRYHSCNKCANRGFEER